MLRTPDRYSESLSSSTTGIMQQTTKNPQHFQCSVDLRSARNSAVAGYAAGITGVILGHPLDSIKVWIQTNSTGRNKHLVSSPAAPSSGTTSSMSASASLARSASSHQPLSGTASMSTLASRSASVSNSSMSFSFNKWLRTVRALYSGVSGPLITVGIVQSINFTTYDAVRRVLHRRDHPEAGAKDYLHQDSLRNVGIAGFVAGTGLAFVTSPLILVKTRQQVTGQGFRQAFSEAFLSPTTGRLNLSRCFLGIYPHLLSETLGRSMYYMAYEGFKRGILKHKQNQLGVDNPDATVTLLERMGSAGTAGIVCWSIIYPLDSLRNRLYTQAGLTGSNVPHLGTWEMAKHMYKEGALYRGFSLTIVRAGPVAAIVLPVYDLVLEMMASRD